MISNTFQDFKAVLTLSGIVPDEQLLEDDLKLVEELEKDISNVSNLNFQKTF